MLVLYLRKECVNRREIPVNFSSLWTKEVVSWYDSVSEYFMKAEGCTMSENAKQAQEMPEIRLTLTPDEVREENNEKLEEL